MFSGASSIRVRGGKLSNSQRDHIGATFFINVGGSHTNTTRSSEPAVSQTRTSGLPHTSTSSASNQEQSSILEESNISTDSVLGGSDASFEIESPPTEENPVEQETSQAIYKRHMLLKKCGYPLWIPQPNETLPRSYQRQGVSIGDVGIFTPDGGFDFLFNICLPAGHPSNPPVLPKGFSRLDLKPSDVCKFHAHTSHSHMTSPLVQKLGATFECSGSDGAILTMPQGAYHEDVRNVCKFKDYASIHAKSWYQYANVRCGREIGKGELHLVTGCDKTTSWGIAAYSNLQSNIFEDNMTRLTFNVRNDGRGRSYPTYTWKYEGTAEAKAGPEDNELMGVRNQCTFVRSLALAVGEDDSEHLPSKVATSVEARASAGPSRMKPLGSASAATTSPPGHISSVGGRSRVGTSRLADSMTPAQAQAAHPATDVIDMLLKKCPKAKVVVVHDSDWCSVIRDSDDDWLSTSQDIQHRIQEAFDIVEEENGTVYLQEKMGSSQQPSTSSHVPVKLEGEDLRLLRHRQPVPDAAFLKFIFSQTRKMKNEASFEEASSSPWCFKASSNDCDDDAGSESGKDCCGFGLARKDIPQSDLFLESSSFQVQKSTPSLQSLPLQLMMIMTTNLVRIAILANEGPMYDAAVAPHVNN